jgi:hypothetical protein
LYQKLKIKTDSETTNDFSSKKLFSLFEKRFFHGEFFFQSRLMVMKNSEKSRFSTTSLRKIILDVFSAFGLRVAKIHKNVEYCESKISLFVGQKLP